MKSQKLPEIHKNIKKKKIKQIDNEWNEIKNKNNKNKKELYMKFITNAKNIFIFF